MSTEPSVSPFEAQWRIISNPSWLNIIINDVNYHQKTLQSSKRIVFIKRDVNFNAAVRVCQTIGGVVILPVTREENREINDFIIEHIGYAAVWLRISDEYQEGTWRDTFDQKEVNFSHWYQGEPNNNGGNEDYAILRTRHWKNSNGAGSWHDVVASRKYYILCELK